MAFALLNLARIVAIARFDRQLEREAQRLKKRRLSAEKTSVGGVAEAVLKGVEPELIERVRDRIAKDKASDLSAEKKQVQANHQERPKQRQKKLVREHAQGIEF